MKTHKMMNQIRREYDQLSEVCLTWARQNYLSWYNNVDNKVRIALRAPLLIRCPETKKFYVNYDPEIDKILREAKYFERIGQQFEHAKDEYQLPQGAKDLLRRKDEVKNAKTQMEMCLKTFDAEIARIPTIFKPLFEKHERAVRLKINKVRKIADFGIKRAIFGPNFVDPGTKSYFSMNF